MQVYIYCDDYILIFPFLQSDAFQSDIFPPCISDEPALTADEWFEGKNANPKLIDLEAGFTVKAKKEFTPSAPVEEAKPDTASASSGTGSANSAENNVSVYFRQRPFPPINILDTYQVQEQLKDMSKENEELKNVVAQKDTKIRVLEIEVDKLRTELAELALAKKNEELKAEKLEELPHSGNALAE